MPSATNIEDVLLLLAQLSTRYPKSLESLCDATEQLGIKKSPDTIRRWLNILVRLGYAEKTRIDGKDIFKRTMPLTWVTKLRDSLILTLTSRYFACLLLEHTQKQYQTLFETCEMNAQNIEDYRQWLSCIEIDLPTEHSCYYHSLHRIKAALIQRQTLRLTLIGQCLRATPIKLHLSTQGLALSYLDNQQLKQIPMLPVLAVHTQ